MEKIDKTVSEREEILEAEAQENTTELPAGNESEELNKALLEANIKLNLLLAGTAKERLEEAAKLAGGLCAAGKSPEEAAYEIINEYPHLKAVQREIPQLASQSSGSDDGFAAIRNIFASRK